MSRYIDAGELLELYDIDLDGLETDKPWTIPLEVVKQNIKDMPSADVEPVRHGKWSHDYIKDSVEYNDYFNLHCSVCGEMQRDAWGKWNYCPYCGAKMDGEEQEHE